ncbi:MAG: transposase, partial [Limisphaerales bacterium]
MKRKRHIEEQIIQLLKQHEAGTPVKQLMQQAGIRKQTFCRWKNKMVGWRYLKPTFEGPGGGEPATQDNGGRPWSAPVLWSKRYERFCLG